MKSLHNILLEETPCLLLENTRDRTGSKAWLFTNPSAEIRVSGTDDLMQGLSEIDEQRKKGLYIAGYINYEAAYYLIDKLAGLQDKSSHKTLLHFYAFAEPRRCTFNEIDDALGDTYEHEPFIHNIELSEAREQYLDQIVRIQRYILEGDTYQVNHTIRMSFDLEGSQLALYKALRARQSVEYSAFLRTPEKTILSLSPELFIEKKSSILTSRPMKGTSPRGTTSVEDAAIKQSMTSDEKQLSENLMIVDLMRNDIGKLAKVGSMQAKQLFEIQEFETLFQMISTIRGEVDKDVTFLDVVKELFPCGSITGTPKIRTMEIIHELESQARGVYTGAIGYIAPDNDFTFNVPIRTIEFDASSNHGQLGIGGGIIHESDAIDEWQECLLKAKFLTGLNGDFSLIETCRVSHEDQHIDRLDAHLTRLNNSAKAFAIPCIIRDIREKINTYLQSNKSEYDLKLKLLLNANGELGLSSEELFTFNSTIQSMAIADQSIIAESLFRKHKTSRRLLYNKLYQYFEERGYYDVIFLNQYGRVAEASRHNIYIEKNGKLKTPPLIDGALPGVFRQSIFEDKTQAIEEAPLTLADLYNADKVFLSNSVRGFLEVQLTPTKEHGY